VSLLFALRSGGATSSKLEISGNGGKLVLEPNGIEIVSGNRSRAFLRVQGENTTLALFSETFENGIVLDVFGTPETRGTAEIVVGDEDGLGTTIRTVGKGSTLTMATPSSDAVDAQSENVVRIGTHAVGTAARGVLLLDGGELGGTLRATATPAQVSLDDNTLDAELLSKLRQPTPGAKPAAADTKPSAADAEPGPTSSNPGPVGTTPATP
jgi:hypothetical protein